MSQGEGESMQTCSRCGLVKRISKFNEGGDGLPKKQCKVCCAAVAAKWKASETVRNRKRCPTCKCKSLRFTLKSTGPETEVDRLLARFEESLAALKQRLKGEKQ